MQNYTKIQKILSFTLIFSILFSFSINISFFSFLWQVFASNSQSYNLVSIYVQEDIYSWVKSKLNRYARDVAWVLENTKTMIIPVPATATPYDIVKFNERLYTSWYDWIDWLSWDSKLVWSLFVWNIPLPVVQNSQTTSKTVFPYIDFIDKLYIYNETKSIFEINNNVSSEPKAEIWHGFISPNSWDNDTDEQKINDYLDKNHDYYIWEWNFKKENNITNWLQDEELSENYEPYVFYYDQVREFNALKYTDYKAYKSWMWVIEDIVYSRFSKILTNTLQQAYNKEQASSLWNLSSIFWNSIDFSKAWNNTDTSKIPDIQLSTLINNYTKKFIEVFNWDTIWKFRKFVYNAWRYNKSWNDVNVDLVPTIVTNLDVFSQSILKNVNNDLEDEINNVVKNWLSRNIALPTNIDNSDNSCWDAIYTNFLNWKQASTISQAIDCSIYRGSLTNSWNLVEWNRWYNFSIVKSDVDMCQDKTSWYWWGNSPINIDYTKVANLEYVLKSSNLEKATSTIFDITWTKASTWVENVPSPLDCLDNNYIVTKKRGYSPTYGGWSNQTSTCVDILNVPINWTQAVWWNCSSVNENYTYKKSFDEVYKDLSWKSKYASCVNDVVNLWTKEVLKVDWVCFDQTTQTTLTPDKKIYNYKKIPSFITHTSPTTNELSAQTKSMISKALPIDKDRYVDFISADNSYWKINYPYLFRLKLDDTKEINLENAKNVLKNYLSQKSKEINDLISSKDPSKLNTLDKEIYDLLKTWNYPDANIDLYKILESKPAKEVVLNNEKKTINYIDTLAFAIYWNNLSSVSSKYKFVFEKYLSDQYKSDEFSFFLPKNRQSYELAYIWAPWDWENMYIKMDPEQKGENPFADILTQNQELDNKLLNLNITNDQDNSNNKCSPPEWVPIWEWIPAVTCRLKDMLPPKISVSDWSCWSSLSSFMWYWFLDEDKDWINDYLQTDLNWGGLLLESDSKKYYYNTTWVLQASLVDKNNQVLTLDSSSTIDFELVKVESVWENNSKELVYDKDYPISQDQDEQVKKYINFKDLSVNVKNWTAKYIFSTKSNDANFVFRALLNLKDYNWNTVIQKEKYLSVQVRGDLVYMWTSKLYNDWKKLLIDSSLSSVTASDKNNIYLVEQDNFNLLKQNLENLNSYSSSKDKMFLTLINKDKNWKSLRIDYPIVLKVSDAKWNIVLNKTIQDISWVLSLWVFKSSWKYVFNIKDNNWYVIEKNIQVLPDDAVKIVPELSTNLMEKSWVVTTNVFSIYDQYDNPSIAKNYTVDISISWWSVAFEDNTNKKSFNVFDWYKPFRLKSTWSTWKSTISFVLKKDKVEIQKVEKTINVVEKIEFDVTWDFENVKVWNKSYDYDIKVKQVWDSNFSARAYLVSNKVYYTSSNDYIDIKNNYWSWTFVTKTKAWEKIKLEFKVEWVKESVYKEINILPDLAIKVDLSLSKSKIEASTWSTSTLWVSLKDRYWNVVWNDNDTKLNFEVHSNYKNIITPSNSTQTAIWWKTTFTLKWTQIPWTAFFKVSTTPDLSKNVITINSNNFFTKSDVKKLWFFKDWKLTETWEKLFKVITDNDYKFAYETYADFEKSLDFWLVTEFQKINIKKFFDNIKTLNVSWVWANVWKIESFYYWNNEKIKNNNYNSIYSTLLWAPYWDITIKDNLASSMIFDKDNRSLVVTSLLNDVQKRTDVLNISPNWNILLNNSSSNLSQDIKTYYNVDNNKDFNLAFVNETLWEVVSNVIFNFNKDNLVLSKCLDANTSNCFDKMKSSIVLKSIKTWYKTEFTNDTLKFYDNTSSKILEIDENWKILTKWAYLSFEINKNYTNSLVLNLKINWETVWIMWISLKYSQINFVRDAKLIQWVKLSQKQWGIVVYLEEKNYSYTKQFSWNSTNSNLWYSIYYNDILASNKPALNKFSTFFEYWYENFYSQEWIWWETTNKTLLLVSAWESVWEATKKYQTFSMINIWDPVVSLKQTKKKLWTTTKTRNFDSTIWKAISLDSDNLAYNVLDFDWDWIQDIVVLKTGWNIKLLTWRWLWEFDDKWNIAYLWDLSTKPVIETWDFNWDWSDDIVLLSDKLKPILLANIWKKLYRYDLKKEIVLKWTLSQIVAKDLDLDWKSDLVTLDDSWEINVFYWTSENWKFDKKFISWWHWIKLSTQTRIDNGLVYYDWLFQLPWSGSNEYLTTSDELYKNIQKNLQASNWTSTKVDSLNESFINNIIFKQISYSTWTSFYDSNISDLKQNIIKAIPSSNSSELWNSLDTTKQDFEYLTNTYLEKYNSWNIIYNNLNTQALTTFIKSEYSSYDWVKVEKKYINLTNTQSDILRGGDKVKLDINITNTSNTPKTKFVYLEKIPTPFALSSKPNFNLNIDWYSYTWSNLPIKNSPNSEYAFLMDSYISWTNLKTITIYPGQTINLQLDLDTNYFTYWYIQAGDFNKDDKELDIIFKPDYRSCWSTYDMYKSKWNRNYKSSEEELTCSSELPENVSKNAVDTDNNWVPDYVDKLANWTNSDIQSYASWALDDLYQDSDWDWIADNQDISPDFNSSQDFMDSLDKINETTDEILTWIDIITQWLWCWFGWGSCISSPLNRAPLAPWNDPTLFWSPIWDWLKVNEWIPVFSMVNYVPVGHYCVPMPWPPWAMSPWCWSLGAWWSMWITNPTNYLRIFVTPTITWAVWTAICFGQPAVAWYSNPPWVHPLVTWWNCIVAAKPVVWCKNDWSDGTVYDNITPTISWDEYSVYNWNCNTKEKTQSLYIWTLASDYLSYKKTWNIDQKSFNEKLSDLVANTSNNSSYDLPNWPLVNIWDSWDDASSVDVDFQALKDWNFSDVVDVSMQRVSAFPDFIMNWVTRQLEEIANKLTDFPTLFVILPDFSWIVDTWWNNFFDNFEKSYETWKQDRVNEQNEIQKEIDYYKEQKKSLDCNAQELMCSNIDIKISELETSKNYWWSQIQSWISGVYEFMSNLPIINIQPQKVYVDIPWADQATIDKAILDWKLKSKQRKEEVESVKERWNLSQYNCIENPSSNAWCKVIVDAENLIYSLDQNIEVLESYKKLPEQIHEMLQIKEVRLEQILCNVEAISKMMSWRISENWQIFKTWVELYVLIKAILKSWQLLADVFIDYQEECYQCKNERQDLMYYIWKLISVAIPTMPVIQFPKWPDIYLDLHNIRAWLTIYMPEFEFNLRPIVLPTLPNLYLPESPSLTLNLPQLPVLPTITLPELPELPSLPSVELPNLPPAPTLPKLFSSIEWYLNILKVITKVMCILKTSPFVPEWRAWDQIAFITERNTFSDFDFLDISTPQFSLPFIDAIKITSFVNLEFQTEFLVEMANQATLPLNVFTNNIANLLDISLWDVDLSWVTPTDINIDVNSDWTVDDNINDSIQNWIDWANDVIDHANDKVEDIQNLENNLDSYKKDSKSITLLTFSKILAVSLVKLQQNIKKDWNKNLTNTEFKNEISKQLAKKSVQSDLKAQKLVENWKQTLNYSFSKENEIISNLLKNNENKFKTLENIINSEKQKNNQLILDLDKKLSTKSNNILIWSTIKTNDISEYNKQMAQYNQKTIDSLKKVYSKDSDVEEIKTQSKEIVWNVVNWLKTYTKDLEKNISSNKNVSTLQNNILSYTSNDEVKKNLVALNTQTSTTNDEKSKTSCNTSKYWYNYKWLYIVETYLWKKLSYRLFDYLDELTWKEIIKEQDMDNDWDSDAIYMVWNEIYFKQNITSKPKSNHFTWSPIIIDDFIDENTNLAWINWLTQTKVISWNFSVDFKAPTNKNITNFNLELYDVYDKFNDVLNHFDSSYIPKQVKKVVIDAFSNIENITIDKELSQNWVVFRNNLAYVDNIWNLASVRLTTNELKNIKSDLESNLLVLINAKTKVYSSDSSVNLDYYLYKDKTKTIKSIKIPSYKNISFNQDIVIVWVSNDTYIFKDNLISLSWNEIIKYLKLPLSTNSKIEYTPLDNSYTQAVPFMKLKYYDSTTRSLSFDEIRYFSIKDLWEISNDYEISSEIENGFYYGKIRAFSNWIYSNYSNQIAITPQKQSDKKAPEISNFNIDVPVYEKKTIDITDYINEDSWLNNIKDIYVDQDLSKDSSWDWITYNDIDYSLETKSNNFLIKKISWKITVDVWPYESLVKKKIRIFVIDENDNLWYKDINFEVFSVKPKIDDISNNKITWSVEWNSKNKPISFYRIRWWGLAKLYDKDWKWYVNTNDNWKFEFNLNSQTKWLELKYTKDWKQYVLARVNEETWKIDISDSTKISSWLDVKVLPSNSQNNSEAYPKIIISKNGQIIYYEYIVSPNVWQVEIEDDFALVKNIWVHYLPVDNTNYGYFSMPLTLSKNPWDMFIYEKNDDKKTPIITIFKDWRVNVLNQNYSMEYTTYWDYVVYNLKNNSNQIIWKIMIIPELNYIQK